jgi:3-oxoacyl-[acyl-carrier protein] reductase
MSRVVVVTGAARGIGDGIARAFLELGDRVVVLDELDPEEPRDGATYIRGDVSDPESIEVAFSRLERIDVLVNNAGVQRVGLTGELSSEDWLRVIGTNLNGGFFCSSAAVSRMRTGGSIIFISSSAAFIGLPGRGPYTASKSGLLGLMRVMAVELASQGIRVNAVCPGFTRTPMIQRGIDHGYLQLQSMLERVPMNRMAEIEEIARVVRFLASDDASYVTGQEIVVDGGWTIQGIGDAAASPAGERG